MRGATVLGILAALAGVGLALASGLLISRAALRPEVFLSLTLLVTAVRALGLGRAALRYAERLTGHAAALKLGEDMRLAWFDRVSLFGRDLLARERSGDLMAHVQTDVDARQFWLLRVRLPLVAFAGVVLLFGGWLLSLDLLLGLLAALPLGLAAGAVWGLRGKVAALNTERLSLSRRHSASLLDALAASADGAQRHFLPRLAEERKQVATLTRREVRLNAWMTLARETMFALAVTGVLWRGVMLLESGTLAGPLLAAAVLATAAAFDAAAQLSGVPAAHTALREAQEHWQALEQLQPAVNQAAVAQDLPAGPLALEMRNVTLKRAGRTVLGGLCLNVAAGERLVITGPSGGGKTTLLRLLLREMDVDTGEVQLGGLPLPSLKLASLRRALSFHEQDAPLLDGTLAENLRMADPAATDERLRDLLTRVGLAHLPLDTWVGEGGTRLSGGERARVSVLRALLAPSRLVLLDEPTAHLDDEAEAALLDTIAAELRGRTLLLVSHRPAPLRLAERVLRLSGGQLSELFHSQRSAV